MEPTIPPRKSNQSTSKQPNPLTQTRISTEIDRLISIQNTLLVLSESKLENLSLESQSLKQSLQSLNDLIDGVNKENQELESIRAEKFKSSSQVLSELKASLTDSECRNKILQQEQSELEKQNSDLIISKNLKLREKENLSQSISELQSKYDESLSFLADLQEKDEIYDLIIESYQESITSYQKKREDAHSEIKKLNNVLQELKGNIRVYCKIRPVLQSDRSHQMAHIEITEKSISIYKSDKPSKFFFDRVFGPSATNNDVFEEVSQLVQSALEGYKVCIFAYGQTGSGKTYTMEGPNNQETKGIIQKSVEQMFEYQQKLIQLGWSFYFKASAIEIYNEQLRDLFDNRKVLTGFSTSMIYPHTIPIYSYEELAPLLIKARKSRAEAETESNAHSSRSHFLFKIEISGEKDLEQVNGVLNMIDLAGSERLKKSKVEGERLEETKAINKSLSSLGLVIQALIKKDKYVPYRNTKLTSILQNCLGGDGKTLMFVNISPLEENLKETINSLVFAQKVNACTLDL